MTMGTIGHVESLWRYPVKSMRGQEIGEAFLGFAGVYGDRLYAFRDAAAQKGFPFLTAREQEGMLLYQPKFRHPDRAVGPPNLAEAESMVPGITPVYGSPADLMVDVEAPSGQIVAIDDPSLLMTGSMHVTGFRFCDRSGPSLTADQSQCSHCKPSNN